MSDCQQPLFPPSFVILERSDGIQSFFNKSFPRCVSSLENRFTSFDSSLGKHTSRSKKKRWLWHTSAFSGKNIYYRSEQIQQAETLVTVSPCEFPPRCHPRASFFVIPASFLVIPDLVGDLLSPLSPRSLLLVIPDLVGDLPSFPAFHSPFI